VTGADPGSPPRDEHAGRHEDARRDAVTIRRGLRAGAVVWVALGAVFTTVVIRAGGDGAAGLAAVMLGLTAGSLVASGWLLLAALLDLLAGARVGRRRVIVTAAVVLFAFASPMLVVGAQAAR
jgi:hypothetical protein